jgi:hypothetical protein
LQKNFGPGFVRGFVVLLGFSGVFWEKWCFVVVFLRTECGGLRGNRDMETARCRWGGNFAVFENISVDKKAAFEGRL